MTYSRTPKYYTNMDAKKHTNKAFKKHFKKNQYFLENLTMKKFKKLVKTLAVSSLGLGIATVSISEAKAASLVPQQEGEIQLINPNSEIDCVTGNCIDTTPLGYTVESLLYDDDGVGPEFGRSNLFVDDRSTANDYGFGITFNGHLTQDAGTNPDENQFFFRPVANILDEQGNLVPFEDGQLEVGRYKFNFENTIGELKLDFFDVEDGGVTGVIEQVNGQTINVEDLLLDAGPDGNVQSLVLNDVKSFVVQLGNPGPNSRFSETGDGVLLQVSVPESETTIGLSVLAVAGVLTLKRRKRASQKA